MTARRFGGRTALGRFLGTLAGLGLISVSAMGQSTDSFVGYWGHMGDFAGFTPSGPPIGDYQFLPLTDDGRMRAESWNPGIQSQMERQCMPHSAVWVPFGPTPLEIIDNGDHLVFRMQSNEVHRIIWMDGREHPPPYALHTWTGFSTAEWQGNTLKITTTHTKEGFLRRNGVPNSERATITEYLTRHDSFLTDVVVVEDPVYLQGPLVRHQTYRPLSDDTELLPYPCEPTIYELAGADPNHTPHYLPGQNPFLQGGFRRSDEFND